MIAKQVTFDRAASGLLQQNARSANGTRCLFRGPGGKRCALGFLIEDHEYSPIFDADSNFGFRYIAALGHDQVMMNELMSIHDRNPPETWAYLLSKLAAKHGLSSSVIDIWAEAKGAINPSFYDKVAFKSPPTRPTTPDWKTRSRTRCSSVRASLRRRGTTFLCTSPRKILARTSPMSGDDLRKIVPICPTCGVTTRACKYEEGDAVIEGVWCKACKHVWKIQEPPRDLPE